MFRTCVEDIGSNVHFDERIVKNYFQSECLTFGM
jgi:hypothetical protein